MCGIRRGRNTPPPAVSDPRGTHQNELMRRIRIAVSTFAACVLVLSMPAVGGGRPTVVHRYSAFARGKLDPSVTVTRRVHGRCDAASEVEGRPFVWLCDWAHYLADPCFSATATSVGAFCPYAPWSRRGVFVVARLRGWKPNHPEIDRTWPWGIRTTTGLRCVAIRTGTSFIRGLRVNHACNGRGFLVGPVDRHSTPWTILYGSRFDGNRTKLTRVGVTDAWW